MQAPLNQIQENHLKTLKQLYIYIYFLINTTSRLYPNEWRGLSLEHYNISRGSVVQTEYIQIHDSYIALHDFKKNSSFQKVEASTLRERFCYLGGCKFELSFENVHISTA